MTLARRISDYTASTQLRLSAVYSLHDHDDHGTGMRPQLATDSQTQSVICSALEHSGAVSSNAVCLRRSTMYHQDQSNPGFYY